MTPIATITTAGTVIPAPADPGCAGCTYFRPWTPILDPVKGVSVSLGDCNVQGRLVGAEDICGRHSPRT